VCVCERMLHIVVVVCERVIGPCVFHRHIEAPATRTHTHIHTYTHSYIHTYTHSLARPLPCISAVRAPLRPSPPPLRAHTNSSSRSSRSSKSSLPNMAYKICLPLLCSHHKATLTRHACLHCVTDIRCACGSITRACVYVCVCVGGGGGGCLCVCVCVCVCVCDVVCTRYWCTYFTVQCAASGVLQNTSVALGQV